jgi:hypothetical protein
MPCLLNSQHSSYTSVSILFRCLFLQVCSSICYCLCASQSGSSSSSLAPDVPHAPPAFPPCPSCSRLLCATYLNEDYFDLVDVDSFGCETMHLPAAIDSVKYGGMLYLTSTDGFSGAGNYQWGSGGGNGRTSQMKACLCKLRQLQAYCGLRGLFPKVWGARLGLLQ